MSIGKYMIQALERTSKFTELISPANSGLFVMNGLFVNLDLNVECAIDLQISSHKNKGYEQNLTHTHTQTKTKDFIKF